MCVCDVNHTEVIHQKIQTKIEWQKAQKASEVDLVLTFVSPVSVADDNAFSPHLIFILSL